MEVLENLRSIFSDPRILSLWVGLVLFSLLLLLLDLLRANRQIQGLMRWVWILTVAYSGPLGLAVYFYSGRRQISNDSIWRRGFRSVAHCYSGCGAGEMAGLLLTVGVLGLSGWWVAGITFLFAYLAGFGLTVGPLMQDGVALGKASSDAFWSESASITIMEIVAIGVDLWLAGDAGPGNPLFWSSMLFSLSIGLLAAYPVNVLLIHFGVKEGMHDPRMAQAGD
ncbi:MAG: DUF4396 domain-containing protein [Sedimenticola sp.]|nr:DUF4396 domain-containing protein [Sedimenticola sp.]